MHVLLVSLFFCTFNTDLLYGHHNNMLHRLFHGHDNLDVFLVINIETTSVNKQQVSLE